MIHIEKTKVVGWEEAIRGMRTTSNNVQGSDSRNEVRVDIHTMEVHTWFSVGRKDYEMMMKEVSDETGNTAFRNGIVVYADITAPLYWWEQFDRANGGIIIGSCIALKMLAEREMTADDFSHDLLEKDILVEHCAKYAKKQYPVKYSIRPMDTFGKELKVINKLRAKFFENYEVSYLQQAAQMVPQSYNMKRTVMTNYDILSRLYHNRKGDGWEEWCGFYNWIEKLPHAEIIME